MWLLKSAYLNLCYLALSDTATSERALCLVFFAQSLPLSILLGRAQPNPSALCRQPTHHIQMAQWPTHTQQAASMETVCYRTKDTLFLWEQHPSSRDLFMCQVDGSDGPFLGRLFIEIYTSRSHTLKVVSADLTRPTDWQSVLNIVHAQSATVASQNRSTNPPTYCILFRNNRNMLHRFKLNLIFQIGTKYYISLALAYYVFDSWAIRTNLFKLTYNGFGWWTNMI